MIDNKMGKYEKSLAKIARKFDEEVKTLYSTINSLKKENEELKGEYGRAKVVGDMIRGMAKMHTELENGAFYIGVEEMNKYKAHAKEHLKKCGCYTNVNICIHEGAGKEYIVYESYCPKCNEVMEIVEKECELMKG